MEWVILSLNLCLRLVTLLAGIPAHRGAETGPERGQACTQLNAANKGEFRASVSARLVTHAVYKPEQDIQNADQKVLCSTFQGEAEGATELQHTMLDLRQLEKELSLARYSSDAQVGHDYRLLHYVSSHACTAVLPRPYPIWIAH